jgi:Ca-activated chloride channel homolog
MFELANPWFLLLSPLPILIWYFLPEVSSKMSYAVKVPFFDMMQRVVYSEKLSANSQKWYFLPGLIWACLILALAGPRYVGNIMPVERQGRNIMMALDLSGSMQIDDMRLNGRPSTRLAVVKTTAKQFIDKRQGDRIGLILFGSKAYIQTPLTFDRKTVLNMLDDATVGLAGQTTSIGDAIGLAIKRLDKVAANSRVLILLTDGANNSGVLGPIQAAKIAKSDGIKIYTIGIGAREMMVRGFFGTKALNPSTDLDEDTLKEIAKITKGRYFRATDTAQLAQIYQTIDKLEPVKADKSYFRPIKEYYYYPLAFALLLLIYLVAKLLGIPQMLFAVRKTDFRKEVKS